MYERGRRCPATIPFSDKGKPSRGRFPRRRRLRPHRSLQPNNTRATRAPRACNAANATLHLARSPHTGSGRLARAPHHVDRAKISPLQVILSSLSTACGHISPHEVALPFLVFLHPQNYMRESAVSRMRVMGINHSPAKGSTRSSNLSHVACHFG